MKIVPTAGKQLINRVDRGIIRTFEVGIDCSPTIDWSRQVNAARTLKRIIAGALL